MVIDVKIDKLVDNGTDLKAFCTATLDGTFAVHGIGLRTCKRGWTVTMPAERYKGRDGEEHFRDVFHPITLEARRELEAAAAVAYEAAVTAQQ
jgi:stage V sporulation protein G